VVGFSVKKGETVTQKRRKHSAEFKARVGLEALKGIRTMSEIAKEYDVHPVQIGQWKKEIQERLPELFSKGPEPGLKDAEKEKGRLERKVGELTMDLDWLKKKCKQFHIPLDEPK